KIEAVLGGAVRPAHPEELKEITGADAGSIGPVGFDGRILADLRLKEANNLYSGANKNDYHIGGIDLSRDVKNIEYVDLRIVKTGEGCPKCEKPLDVFTAIELGHIFKLGTKYSEAMGATFLDEHGKENPLVMGSYGIGVDRVMACFIEQHHDEKGIVWDATLAPFEIHIIALNMKNQTIVETAEKFYQELLAAGFSVLFDDRIDAGAGVKFNDADLLGMPIQIIIGEKKLKEGKVELKVRETGERTDIEIEEYSDFIKGLWFKFVNNPNDK
ncbi:MAG: His/Gly/Thr/Pro-type tRNA ligase C-terminal domain-containing protein, partial [Ignavibacteria bacterium]|nr:His/Gly/Thr/Pro-type tRNA ligase C-terminal domain-containing protein [Ignavibacteria bacterium]